MDCQSMNPLDEWSYVAEVPLSDQYPRYRKMAVSAFGGALIGVPCYVGLKEYPDDYV
jgi:hypothetical protein